MKKQKFKIKKISLIFLSFFFIFSPFSVSCKNLNTIAESSNSKAECVIELESRRILYESNGETRLPMASTTKIMTAITVLEHCKDLETPFEIPNEAIGVEGSSIYLKEGDKYSVSDLLYGLMLRSGNDSATALALKVGGSLANFSLLMNKTAQKAGALNSSFKNPHGLPHNGHYTTARDLSYITCYALHNTFFQRIVSAKIYEPYQWLNKNKMLYKYPYAIGVKTGYTKEAGRCLVSAANKDDFTLVCTVLSCADMYNRSIELFNSCFSTYKREKIIDKEQVFSFTYNENIIKGKTKQDFYYPLCDGEKEHIETVIRPKIEKNKEIIGEIEIYLLKRLIFSGNLYKL